MKKQWDHHLDWPYCFNVRDLGGFPTESGQTTRSKVFVRADTISRLADQGRIALLNYGVTLVVDVRFHREIKNEPSPVSVAPQDYPSVQYVHLPFTDDPDEEPGKSFLRNLPTMVEVYCRIIDHSHQHIARIFRYITAHTIGSILFHCNAGKDRTGILTALLLSLAGVPDSIIADDYAMSSTYLRAYYQQFVSEPAHTEDEYAWSQNQLENPLAPETMLTVLEHIEKQYGGVSAYLQHIGVSSDELSSLRQRFVGWVP